MHKTLVILGTLLVTLLLVFGACVPTETVTTSPIKDLANIGIWAISENWDADAADDGIALDVWYYDSEGQLITFHNTSVTVSIELFGYGDILDISDHENMELVYQQQVTVDHSMEMSEMNGNYIRIPFENITVDQSKYCELGTIKVTVIIAEQGDFQAMQDWVSLYPGD